MNKRFVIIIVLGLLLSTIIVGLLIPKAKVYKYAYTINYSDENNNSYVINIPSSYDNIKVSNSSDEFIVNFSDTNKEVLKYSLTPYLMDNKTINLSSSDIGEYNNIVLSSIINNDEKILINASIDDDSSYDIYLDRSDCNSVTLSLYKDNTYRYFYTFGSNTGIPKYMDGKYTYDVNKIINNISKYKEETKKVIITNYKDIYETYIENKELQELLNEINVDLDVCLTE